MALYHKWGVKTGFTFSHQFFMLLYDSLGGVSMHYKICIFLLFFVEKCKVDFITFLTTLCQWGIGDFHRKLHVWHVKKPTWMLFQHGAVQWSVLSFQLKALEILPEKNPNPKNKWQKSQHFHLKWMSLVVDLPNRVRYCVSIFWHFKGSKIRTKLSVNVKLFFILFFLYTKKCKQRLT